MNALLPAVKSYADARSGEFGKIGKIRRKELLDISAYVEQALRAGGRADLTFICTHNSRRSHIAQIWAQTAAAYFKLSGVRTFSGGTQVTAFNANAVAAIRGAGFLIEQTGGAENPVVVIRYGRRSEPMRCHSKLYDDPANPQQNFCAVMTCSQADEACPVVRGASSRVSIPYEDPKKYDGTDQQEEKYQERCAEIAREMVFVFSHVNVPPTST